MFRAGQFRDMTGLTPAQAYAMGDLNGDFRNDHADFVIFKHLFETAHGANAFAALFAEVPEPSTFLSAVIAASAVFMLRRAGL
jgi:hypothetical protein